MIAAYCLGRSIVRLHDEDGFPFSLGLERCPGRVALLGIVVEAARRKLSRKLVCDILSEWRRHNDPTPAEHKALQVMQ